MTTGFWYGVVLGDSAKDNAVGRPLARRLRTCPPVAHRRRRKDGLTTPFHFGFRDSAETDGGETIASPVLAQ
jgi:hypothetical protein